MDTAIDVASDRSLDVVVVHVVEVPAQMPLSEGTRLVDDEDEEILRHAARAAREADLSVDRRIRLARDTATGIVGAAEEYGAETVLMGWRGRPPRRDVVLGSYLDRVMRNAPCDVLVKRIRGPSGPVDAILVPVARGAHGELARESAASIARRNDASVFLLHVLSTDASEADRERAWELLREARTPFDGVSEIDEGITESDHVAGAITDRTPEYDLTVLGATEEGLLRRKLLGTVSDGVGRHAENTVIIAHRPLSRTSRLVRLVR
ncbi:universal stress protein [Natronorarus salvus]|uniref:universal stress protein n=1 Tax=Natronorarus salvus TaxID=3117733 RepID=UPI002F2655EA